MTPHFSLSELTQTGTGLDNTPNATELARLIQLAINMEHVRHILGDKPLFVTSGFRSEAVNNAVLGSKTSDHRRAYACDFAPVIPLMDAMKLINDSWLPFDQLILEPEQGIIHISFAPKFRRQVLVRKGQKYSTLSL